MLVAANKELYVTLPKKQKMLLSQSIVNAVRSQNPPGRFLQKDGKTDLWYDVGDKRAQEKTSQALREGAPEIRLKMKDHGPEEDAKQNSTGTTSKPSDDLLRNDGEVDHQKVKSEVATSTPPTKNGSPHPLPHEEVVKVTKTPVARPPSAPSSNNCQIIMTPPLHTTMMAPPVLPPPIPPQGPVPNRNKNKKEQQQQRDGDRNGVKDQHFPHQQQRQVHFTEQQMHQQVQYHAPNQQPYYVKSGDQEVMPPPPSSIDAKGGCSFGSIGMMSVGEQDRLMRENIDDEPIPLRVGSGNDRLISHSSHHEQQNDREIPQPVDGGLEPIGFSFGSMMSIGTDVGMAASAAAGRLERAGLSFGSAMSYSVLGGSRHAVAPPVDGGLQDIGTSFGSLSLADGERERIIALAKREMMLEQNTSAGGEAYVTPTLLQQQKSTGNLLDCSDTESEDEDTSADASAQKSAQWEKLQAALAAQDESMRTSQLTASMPPPSFGIRSSMISNTGQQLPYPAVGLTFQIPTAGLDRDFSQMSAISVQEDFNPSSLATSSYVLPTPSVIQMDVYDSKMPPPPAAIKKGCSDDWSTGDIEDEDEDARLEYTFLNRGNSLASEQF